MIELWVSAQLTDPSRPAAARAGERRPDPQDQARQQQLEDQQIPGLLDRLALPRAPEAEPDLEAG